jgi:predicted Zn-dependent protease
MKAPLLFALAALACSAADQAPLEVLQLRARGLLDKKDYRAALAEAEALNRASPDVVAGYQLMAEALIGIGDYAEAEKQIQWMLDLRIGKADAHGWLLVARFREITGDLDGALDAANSGYARLAPDQQKDRQELAALAGRLLFLAGKLEPAEQTIRQAFTDTDIPAPALETLVRLRAGQGKREEAIRIARRLTARFPEPHSLYVLAEITGAAADYAAFEKAALAAESSPDNANREMALYYSGHAKQPAKALEIARRESLRRHDIYTLDALAVALFANRQMAEARSTIERVLALGTRDPEILSHAARIGARKQ